MIVAKINVDGVSATADYRKTITAGMIGAQVQFDYAADLWVGLHKTVVFRGAVTKDVITDAEVVTIPAEVVAKSGYPLRVGVYGVDADGNLAIPTIWADLGIVRDAADPSGDTTTDSSLPVWAQIEAKIGNLEDLDTNAKNNLVAAVNEAMTKGGGEVDAAEIQRIVEDYLASNPPMVTESDPTVPAWAKQPTKPSYTAAEVGALPDTYTPPNQTAQQVGADPAGTAVSAVSQHNTDTTAHNDLRLAIKELANRINAALDSDDATMDQMSEVVAYIKSNKSLIDAITTSKVSVADIVNDLGTNVKDKPLSAAQGIVIKGLIDALSSSKLDTAELTDAINTALAQAKASGEFDGTNGSDGGYYTPSVTQPDDNTMNVSFTASKEGMVAVPEKTIPLPAGPTGTTPNIQIGTVETLAAGSSATASIDGTPENPVLNLGIPQGAPGTGGGSGIAVTGATVGQTIRVATVDDNGVPTAWEPVDFPSGGEPITAPVELIASGTIPAGQAAWTNIGDIGVTWGDLRQYKSIGILVNNGTDNFSIFFKSLNAKQQIQLGSGVRSYTIFEFVDTEKTKIRFLGSASNAFWYVDVSNVTNVSKWYNGGGANFNFSIVPIEYVAADKISLYTNNATTVESTWYIIGLTK